MMMFRRTAAVTVRSDPRNPAGRLGIARDSLGAGACLIALMPGLGVTAITTLRLALRNRLTLVISRTRIAPNAQAGRIEVLLFQRLDG
jgi:hypothetical protein